MEKLQYALLRERPLSEVIGSAILSIITFLYVYSVASFLNIPVFLLQARLTYRFSFESYVFGEQIDHIIIVAVTLSWLIISVRENRVNLIICALFGALAILSIANLFNVLSPLSLASGPLIIGLLIFNSLPPSGRSISFSKMLYFTYVSMIAIFIGIISLFITITALIPIDSDQNYLRNYAYQVYLILSSLSPVFLILLAFSIPIKLIGGKVIRMFSNWRIGKKENIVMRNGSLDSHGLNILDESISVGSNGDVLNADLINNRKSRGFDRRKVAICLILIISGSSLITLIPLYVSSINDQDYRGGVDTDFYVRWTSDLINVSLSNGTSELLNQVFVVASNGDRPVSLLFILGIAQAAQAMGISNAIDYIPTILAPLLVLSVFFMTREMTLNFRASLFAALLTTMSFQILIGIYAGYYANWLALIIGYSSIGFLFRYLRDPSKADLVIFSLLIVTLLFVHVYTWMMFTFVFALFLAVLIVKPNYYPRKSLKILLFILSCVSIIEVLRSSLIGWVGRDASMQTVELFLGSEYLIERWDTLVNTTQQFLGALFANPIPYLLSLYWLFKSGVKKKFPPNILILLFFSIAIAPVLIGDWVTQSRIIYNIPFQVPAAIALTYFLKENTKVGGNEKSVLLDGGLLVIAVYLWSFIISLRVLLNFYHL